MKNKTTKMSFVVGKDSTKVRSKKAKAQARARVERKENKYKLVF